jgi:hypothetical protein
LAWRDDDEQETATDRIGWQGRKDTTCGADDVSPSLMTRP